MATTTREGQLIEAFVTLADTLVVGYDTVDLLHTLVDKCASLFEATAAGIILSAGDGEFEVIASTNERNRLVELLQLRAGSGPCVEAVTTGRSVSLPVVALSPERWSGFRDSATRQGFQSVLSVPLRLRSTTIGSLNLFWQRIGPLSGDDAVAVQALADVATIGILQERAVRESDVARQQLQHALTSRVLIEQAKGVLAFTHNADMDVAFAMMRSYARGNNVPLVTVAERIVNRTLKL